MVFVALVSTGLNSPLSESWPPPWLSMPMRAGICVSRRATDCASVLCRGSGHLYQRAAHLPESTPLSAGYPDPPGLYSSGRILLPVYQSAVATQVGLTFAVARCRRRCQGGPSPIRSSWPGTTGVGSPRPGEPPGDPSCQRSTNHSRICVGSADGSVQSKAWGALWVPNQDPAQGYRRLARAVPESPRAGVPRTRLTRYGGQVQECLPRLS